MYLSHSLKGTAMKRTVAVAALTLLAGCAAPAQQAEPAPTVTVTAPAPEPAAPVVDIDAEYIADVEMFWDDWRDYGSRAEMVDLGHLVCDALDAGASQEETLGVMAPEIGYEPSTTVMAAALVNYCPELGA